MALRLQTFPIEQDMRVGLVGASGFVGSAIFRRFSKLAQFNCLPILRSDNFESKSRDVDFIIHSANPAKRYFANTNPEFDRKETFEKTMRFLDTSNGKPFLLVSSISCRTQSETPYGKNRKDCENLVLEYGGSVVRLGPMFGISRLYDVIHDICLNRKVFVSRDSKQSFSSIDWNGSYIADHFEQFSGILEIGARNSITLGEIADHINSRSEFIGDVDDQFPLNFDAGPDVQQVLEFVDQITGRYNIF